MLLKCKSGWQEQPALESEGDNILPKQKEVWKIIYRHADTSVTVQ